jgi:hypothetical protein
MFRVTIRSLDLFNMDLGYGYPTALAAMLVAVAVLSTILPALRASSVAPVTASIKASVQGAVRPWCACGSSET